MIEVEKTGETVATWYADPIWQKCKGNSPGVTVFKSDDVLPVPLAEPFRVDVLTCAVPYVNPNRRKPIPLEKLEDTFNHRIGNILEVAAANGADNLILGAFGCGAFNNPPDLVAGCFRYYLVDKGYRDYFKRVVFAIKGGGRNYYFGN